MKFATHVGLVALASAILFVSQAHAHLGESEKLLATDGQPGDLFGSSVATDGLITVVGAPLHDVSGIQGAAYVFQRTTTADWPEVAKLTPTGAGALDMFGEAMALDGSYLAISAPSANSEQGEVYVFNGFGSTWTQVQVLTASDGAPLHSFGKSIDLEADTMIVGAPGNEAVYVFRLLSGVWVEEQILVHPTAPEVGDAFGTAVSLFGDEALVGAPFEDSDGADAGSAFLYTRSGSVWTHERRMGSDSPGAGDGFGHGVAIGSKYIGIGAPFDDDEAVDGGTIHYFTRTGTTWTSGGPLSSTAAPIGPGDHTGEVVCVDTNIFIITQFNGDLQGAESGGAQTYIERSGVFYGDVVFPSDTVAGDHLGASAAISGCWMAAGAPNDDDLGESSGSAYVFLGTPLTTLYCLPGISGKGCAATLSALGAASASETSGFTVVADGVEGGISGLYFYGTNGPQMNPWGSGTSFQCVVPPTIRMGLITSTGAPNTCTGQFSQDLNATWCSTCPRPLKNPGAGNDIWLQLWYRDPTNTSNQSTSLSNAAVIGVCP